MIARQIAVLACVISAGTAVAGEAPYTRSVRYSPDEVITLRTKTRFTTTVVLPKEERILEFVTGDSGRWVVEGNENLAYIKPGREGITTNVTLVTAAGNVYAFLCEEVGGKDAPDLKVIVVGEPAALRQPAGQERPAVLAVTRDQTASSAGIARVDARAIEHYQFKREKRFRVEAVYTDGRATFIRTHASELPAVYEVLDGKPSLLNFQVEDGGLYVIPKVIEEGYLALGKRRLKFRRREP